MVGDYFYKCMAMTRRLDQLTVNRAEWWYLVRVDLVLLITYLGRKT